FRVQSNNLGGATLQFLIFNEFEQRFSTSTSFTCWKETQLSDIGTHPGTSDNSFSIFNFAVQGTLSGQTRIRPVAGATSGNTVLAISEEFWQNVDGPTNGAIGRFSASGNVHFTGSRDQGDLIRLSPNE